MISQPIIILVGLSFPTEENGLMSPDSVWIISTHGTTLKAEKTGNSCGTFLSKPRWQTVVYHLSWMFNPWLSQVSRPYGTRFFVAVMAHVLTLSINCKGCIACSMSFLTFSRWSKSLIWVSFSVHEISSPPCGKSLEYCLGPEAQQLILPDCCRNKEQTADIFLGKCCTCSVHAKKLSMQCSTS